MNSKDKQIKDRFDNWSPNSKTYIKNKILGIENGSYVFNWYDNRNKNSGIPTFCGWGEQLVNDRYLDIPPVKILGFKELVTMTKQPLYNITYNVEELIIPYSVEIIESYYFTRCPKLRYVEFESGEIPKQLNGTAFDGTIYLNNILKRDGIFIYNSNLIRCGSNVDNLIIPSSVTNICKWAFYMSKVGKVVIDSNIDRLKEIFVESNVKYLYLGKNIKNIDKQAISYCTIGSLVMECSLGAICRHTVCRCDIDKLIIGEGIKRIDKSAFYRCSISEIELPKTLKTISYYAFQESEGEKRIKISRDTSIINDNTGELMQSFPGQTIIDRY